MTIAFVAAALAIAGLFITRPLFVGEPRRIPVSPGTTRRDALLRRKENVYAAIKDLEFEFRTGKLSPADHAELRERYRAEALEILQELEEVEGELRTSRQAKPRPRCSACGHRNPSNSNFCEACGSPIEGGHTCPVCNTAPEPGDRFCAICGSGLTQSTAVTPAADANDHLAVELTP